MENKKENLFKKTIGIGVVVFVFLILSGVTVTSAIKEINKYTSAWKEIQFAKEHPMLVESMREEYEVGLEALERMVMEKEIVSPIPTSEPLKESR